MSAQEPLHVLVVGAGFCGLASAIACREQGMAVTVLEQATELLPIGDSIGFGPNVTRLFRRWGIFDRLDAIASHAPETVVHNWDSAVLARDPTQGQAEAVYGHPGVIGHRGDLHAIFLDEAVRRGAEVRLGCRIVDYDQDKPSAVLEGGEEVVGDVIIASDGVKSLGREKVLGCEDKPVHSGYAVYRAFMDSEPFRDDPLTKHFLESDQCHLWIGADLHGYVTTLQGGAQINAVLTHKDVADIEEGWSFPGKREDVLKLIRGWDPAYVRVWEKMENIIDFKLVFRPCMDRWVTDSGLVIVAGDAAHPFLPTSTQGASQAIEDAATIALCLARAGRGKVPLALHAAFRLRHEHARAAQQMGVAQRNMWHNMHDRETGEMTQELDMSEGLLQGYRYWAYDCEKVVRDDWDAVSSRVELELRSPGSEGVIGADGAGPANRADINPAAVEVLAS